MWSLSRLHLNDWKMLEASLKQITPNKQLSRYGPSCPYHPYVLFTFLDTFRLFLGGSPHLVSSLYLTISRLWILRVQKRHRKNTYLSSIQVLCCWRSIELIECLFIGALATVLLLKIHPSNGWVFVKSWNKVYWRI